MREGMCEKRERGAHTTGRLLLVHTGRTVAASSCSTQQAALLAACGGCPEWKMGDDDQVALTGERSRRSQRPNSAGHWLRVNSHPPCSHRGCGHLARPRRASFFFSARRAHPIAGMLAQPPLPSSAAPVLSSQPRPAMIVDNCGARC